MSECDEARSKLEAAETEVRGWRKSVADYEKDVSTLRQTHESCDAQVADRASIGSRFDTVVREKEREVKAAVAAEKDAEAALSAAKTRLAELEADPGLHIQLGRQYDVVNGAKADLETAQSKIVYAKSALEQAEQQAAASEEILKGYMKEASAAYETLASTRITAERATGSLRAAEQVMEAAQRAVRAACQ